MHVVADLPVEVRFLAVLIVAMLLAQALLLLAWLGAKGVQALIAATRKRAVARAEVRSPRAADPVR